MRTYLLVGTFAIVCLVQGVHFAKMGIVDGTMWGNQAKYFEVGDQREFDFLQAYGHPGGPVILGTLGIHYATHKDYRNSVLLFLTLADSAVITAIIVLLYALRRNFLWCLAATAVLSLNPLYGYSTPPSALAALLAVLLCVAALYLYERGMTVKEWLVVSWGVVCGLTVATRSDIGSVLSAVFGLLLMTRIGIQRVILATGVALITFCVFDPFMWFMPVKHVQDLVFKLVLHYAEFTPEHLSLISIVSISSIAFVGVLAAVASLVRREKEPPLPPLFVIVLLAMSAVLYAVFMTSHFQAERYFMPVIFLWEMFLPLYVLHFSTFIQFDFVKTAQWQYRANRLFRIGIALLFVAYYATTLPFLVG